MGIHVKIKPRRRRAGLTAQAIGRLTYMETILRYFENMDFFIPTEIQAWHYADNEPMGGTLIWKYTEVSQMIQSLKESWIGGRFWREEWFDSVILVKGTFNIGDKFYSGYISANNDMIWRSMYMDLTIDCYGEGEKGDLTLLLLDNGFTSHVKNFISEVATEQIDSYVYISEIYWSVGPTGFGNVDEICAVHLPSWAQMVTYMIKSMSKEDNPVYENQISPLRSTFFGSALVGMEEVRNSASDFMAEEEILEVQGGSVTYISEDPEAFRRFYEKFRDRILIKAGNGLPQADDLKNRITYGIRESLGVNPEKKD